MKKQKQPKKTASMPTMTELTDFLNKQSKPVNKKEIARRFGIRGDNRVLLKGMLKQLRDDGTIQSHKRVITNTGTLPATTVVEITGFDDMGDLVARPIQWDQNTPAPQIIITHDKLNPPAGMGDVVQVKTTPVGKNVYEATALRRVTAGENHMIGIYKNGVVSSVDRRLKQTFEVHGLPKGIRENDILIVDIPPIHHAHPVAEFVKKIGSETDAFAPTLISIYLHNIPVAFSKDSEKQAQKAKVPPLGKRTDLRAIPFVTIDGADAKDFDDAVFAEPDPDQKNKGGFHVMIAIADVAFYVRPHTPLNQDAWTRGNSVYFPDRVIPMLPFELSNGVCSLNPDEPRAAMVCEAWLDKTGHKIKHRFLRALIQSARRLTYDEVQTALDGGQPIRGLEPQIQSLHDVYKLLAKRRAQRGVLELDIPERQVVLNDKGQVTQIKLRVQTDAHKLIEEMMILANVSAAETLEDKNLPTMYRVHDKPSDEKRETLNDFLNSLGYKITMSPSSEPKDFNAILTKAHGTKQSFAVNNFVLRSQSQAVYSPENIGHFGLALDRYAHFTSPIRRYADLMVHRALISAYQLGDDGLPDDLTTAEFEETARHISYTERQAASAEQDAIDRYTARFLANRIGESFTARISGVTSFGLFVTVEPYNADGFIPISSIRGDFYEYDQHAQQLIGRGSGVTYQMGQSVRVLLKECVPVTGGLIFSLIRQTKWESGPIKHKQTPRKSKTRKPAKRKKH